MTITDEIIRTAVHLKLLRRSHADAQTLVVNELGLHHGYFRADVATINGILHGFEIKSDADNLKRLPLQISAYDAVFDKSTLIVGEKHYQKAIKLVPKHWGIVIARPTNADKIKLTITRRAKINRNVDLYSLAQLLWKNEAREIISTFTLKPAPQGWNRTKLYNFLVENLSARNLHSEVCNALKNREDWKDHVIL